MSPVRTASNHRKVALVAGARTKSRTPQAIPFHELLVPVVSKLPAYLRKRIDTVYLVHGYPFPLGCAFDFASFLQQTGLSPNAELKREDSARLGGLEMVHQAIQELSGARNASSTVLVIGGELLDVTDRQKDPFDRQHRRNVLAECGGIPAADVAVGLTTLSAHALVADAFFRHHRLSRDDMDELMERVTCHLEKYARANPNAYQHHRHSDAPGGRKHHPIRAPFYKTQQDRTRKWPFTLFDICGLSHSEVAVVLTNDLEVASHADSCIAECVVSKPPTKRGRMLGQPALHQHQANVLAWGEMSARLRLKFDEPPMSPKWILELVDMCAIQLPMTLIEMGLCPDVRTVIQGFKNGFFDLAPTSDDLPPTVHAIPSSCRVLVNPSGGSKDSQPLGAYGLVRAVECFQLLTGKTDLRQSPLVPGDQVGHAFVNTLSLSNTAAVLSLKGGR